MSLFVECIKSIIKTKIKNMTFVEMYYISKFYLTQGTSRMTGLVHRTFVSCERHAEASLLHYRQNRLMPYRAIKL